MVTEAFANNSTVFKQRSDEYELKKAKLANDLKQLITKKTGNISIQKKTSNLFRHRPPTTQKIDVRSFNKVLSIDPVNLVAEVEGMITYEDFVNECLQFSCLPAVVPELKSITVGGAISGGAIESSSFRYGLVHETVSELEVLLADGRIILCNPNNEHRDFFYGFPNSYGTLGYALKVKIKLLPAKKYIKLTHHHFTDPTVYFKELEQLCAANKKNGSIAYIDGVIFEQNDLYITTGEFIDKAPQVSNYKYMNIYYRSIQKNKTDFLTSLDYIWRWDPDWFWCSKFFFMQNRTLRFLFGKLLLKSTAYWQIRHFANRNPIIRALLSKLQQKTESVIQDVQIPISHSSEFFSFLQNNIDIKPIWICPTMPVDDTQSFSLCRLQANSLYLNFGFWDVLPIGKEDGYYNKLIEANVQKLHGHKGLYSNVYYTEEEFWNIYDKNSYTKLKKIYDSQNRLKDLYKKCSEK